MYLKISSDTSLNEIPAFNPPIMSSIQPEVEVEQPSMNPPDKVAEESTVPLDIELHERPTTWRGRTKAGLLRHHIFFHEEGFSYIQVRELIDK